MKHIAAFAICLCLLLTALTGCGAQSAETVESTGTSRQIVQFVSSQYSSVFAVLYSDGTVGVGGRVYTDSEEDLESYYPALGWKNVEKLYLNTGTLLGLCGDGTVKSVGPDWGEGVIPLNTEHLTNVVDVGFMEPDQSYFFLLEDGTLEFACETYEDVPDYEPFDGVFRQWTGVSQLIPYFYYDIFGIFEDGTVRSMGEYGLPDGQQSFWTGIRELYVDQKYYGIRADGSVVIHDPYPEYSSPIPNENISLQGASALYPIGDVAFGLTEEGELLISGGKEWFFEEYCEGDADTWTDLSQFTQIRQLIVPRDWGMEYVVALREDGKAVALNRKLNENLAYLPQVEKLALGFDYEGTAYICGVQADGNVVGVEFLPSGSAVLHKDHFRGWKVEDLHATMQGTLIGFCPDGSIVSTGEEDESSFLHFMTPVAEAGK